MMYSSTLKKQQQQKEKEELFLISSNRWLDFTQLWQAGSNDISLLKFKYYLFTIWALGNISAKTVAHHFLIPSGT